MKRRYLTLILLLILIVGIFFVNGCNTYEGGKNLIAGQTKTPNFGEYGDLKEYNYCDCEMDIQEKMDCLEERNLCISGSEEHCWTYYRMWVKSHRPNSCELKNITYNNISECLPNDYDCISEVAIKTDNLEICYQLPEKVNGKQTYRGNCIIQIAKKRGDRTLCNQIKDSNRKRECEEFFEKQDERLLDWDYPYDEGDGSNMPRFIATYDLNYTKLKIVWWAKNFEVLDLYMDSSGEFHIKLKLSNGTIRTFNIVDPSIDLMFDKGKNGKAPPTSFCEDNPACNNFTWEYERRYQQEDNYVHIYCLTSIPKCKEILE